MKKFKLLSFLLIISLFAGTLAVPALAVDVPEIATPSAIVMDAETGDILFEKNSRDTLLPGGINTLMTVLVAARALDSGSINLSDEVIVTESALASVSDGIGRCDPPLVVNETLSVQELLYLTVFTSGAGTGDAASVLAEYVSGSVDAFVAEMNSVAADLGCVNSHFLYPSGASGDGHYTCVYDLALIAKALTQYYTVMPMFTERSYSANPTAFAGSRQVNALSEITNPSSGYYNEHAYGFRDGGGPDGLRCRVTGARYNDLDLIVVAGLAPDDNTVNSDVRTLYNWAFTSYSYRTLLSSTEILSTIPVAMGSPDSVGVRAEDQIRTVLPVDREIGKLEYQVSYQYDEQNNPLQAPVDVGLYVGDVTVIMDGENYGSSRLVTATSADISRLVYLQTQLQVLVQNPSVRRLITVLLVILAVYLLLVIFYRIQRFLHLRSLRRARRDRAIARSNQEIEWLDIPEDQNGVPVSALPAEDGGEAAAYEEAAPAEGEVYAEAPDGEAGDGQYAQDGYAEEPDGQYAQDGYAEDPDGQYAEDGYAEEPGGQYAEDGYAEDPGYGDEPDPNTFDRPYDQ